MDEPHGTMDSQAERSIEGVAMFFDGLHADAEFERDGFVREIAPDQNSDLLFPGGEIVPALAVDRDGRGRRRQFAPGFALPLFGGGWGVNSQLACQVRER